MFVCCECCVLSGRGLCDELITRPEQSYRLWCVVVCDLETTKILVNVEGGQGPLGGYRAEREKNYIFFHLRQSTDSQRAGRYGDRIPVGVRFSVPVQIGPEAHPASYTMGTGSFPGVKRPGRGVDTHPI